MRNKLLLLIGLFSVLLAACATSESRGWKADGAQPFASAKEECKKAESVLANADKSKDFAECMASRGWSRP